MTATACPEPASDPRLAAARDRCRDFDIVSTLPFHRIRAWCDAVTTLEARRRALSRLWNRLGLLDPLLIPRLLWRARKADAVLLNGGERVDLLYLALAGLAPWIRAPHLIVDAHWQAHPGIAGRLQRLLLRLGRRVLHEAQPHSPEEIELYHRHFGLPRECIRPLPWSTSLTGYSIERGGPRTDEVLSGGFSYRDYPTLFEAIRRCRRPLRVGLPASPEATAAARGAADCAEIQVVTDFTFQAYWEAVAKARVFAMALTPGLTRCSADQTILNAMSFGTVVVATDSISSRLYIRHGENGFLVPEGDPEAFARTLDHVFELPQADYERISEQAAADIRANHREETRLARTLERAADAAERYRGRRRPAAASEGASGRLAKAFGMLAILV